MRRSLVFVLVFSLVTAPIVLAHARRPSVPEWVRHLRPVLPSVGAVTSVAPVTDGAPATPAAQRTVSLLDRIVREARATRYNHTTIVDERRGRYELDCSGLVAWVLARSSPRSLAAIHSSRPVAAEIAATIARAPIEQPRNGWQRVRRLADARPGDVFAWRNPSWLRGSTGHTGFIVGPIEPVRGYANMFRVRITDSNVTGYDSDTRPLGTSGLGTGTSTVTIDLDTGAINGIVVGHLGTSWVLPLTVEVGRLH
ncbi:MAG: hypothetical protein JNK05_11400 [Myxococcales bacterium]|nr:hypothetical protein [Myxococcales bacterium]